MLSALLGAICAVSMAVAPLLVEPSSNISNNDGDFTSVHSAYYDADSVSNYGNTAKYVYNYSSQNIGTNNTLTTSEGVQCSYSYNGGSFEGYVYQSDENGTRFESYSGSTYLETFNTTTAVYASGVLVEEPWTLVSGSSGKSYVGLKNDAAFRDASSYIWIFDIEVINYSITANLTHCTADAGNASAYEGSSITLQYTADEGYNLPESISVSNAEYTWDASSGELVISSASDDVSISIVAYEPAAPVDGVDMVGDIAEGLTGGIGTVASGIGGGLQSLVRNIFLVGTYDAEGNFTATGLSTFGIVTIVMASLALALGLSRWVVGWASSLGERNR